MIPEADKSPLLPSIYFQAGEARLALTETVPAREHFLSASKVKGTPAELAESITGRKKPRLTTPMWLARVGAPFQHALDNLRGREAAVVRHGEGDKPRRHLQLIVVEG